ncbi:MAG: TROVE domain-containing protein, partial [Candidatus Competibacteraceae bacterium]|nr:TROVE domain-containing protein [Candidatus Competibacteraceae bacterium]
MRKNIVQRKHTHEGGRAAHTNPLQALRRSVMACLLWEKEFYEDGETIAERIQCLAHQCAPEDVALMATEARLDFKLRHAPLMLVRELARHPKARGKMIGDAICNVVQRADELAEFLALYWAEGKQPLSKQVKAGLACAFRKFDAYQLAKYNRKGAVSLRDVLFMVHATPKDKQQGEIWRQLVDGTLPAPDTWEVALSGGSDKKEVFTRLMRQKKLGYMALLRNLRNMHEAGVDTDLVKGQLLEGAAKSKALPFRFIAAARACPAFEPTLDEAMQRALSRMDRLPGKTIVLVDVSASMVGTRVSQKSDIDRLDAAAALAALVRGISDDCEVFTFSHVIERKPAR